MAIALALALGGRALLASLHALAPAAAALLGAGILGVSFSIRRVFAAGGDRLELTRRIAYLAALVLGLWAVAAPARWNVGASLAAAEVALAFDVFARLAGPRTTPS